MKRLKFTVLVPVYNEGANIANLLESVVKQRLRVGELERITVVASGCTDETEEIVREWMRRDTRIRLLRQRKRLGKARAINYFLAKDRSKVVVMVGGDVVLKQGCLENLVKHFQDKEVGMVGARIRSVNKDKTFLGFSNGLIWRLHDQMARDYPRLGEVTAWRRVFDKLPKETICDEAEIEMLVRKKGLKLVYEPRAVGYNRGATKWGEYISRRRSVHLGHMIVRRRWGNKVESEKGWLVLKYWLKEVKGDYRRCWWYVGVVLVELLAKFLGKIDYYLNKKELVWLVAKSAKQPVKVR